MSEKIVDGGPAFAAIGVSPAGDVYHQTGMTLRDWFAGQALSSLQLGVEGLDRRARKPSVFAQAAYEYADAMLAEGSQP